MTCPNCGRENAADSAFCSNCGTALSTEARPDQETRTDAESRPHPVEVEQA